MFTAAKIRDGRTYLEGHLSANDYYSENERVTGKWVGKGAQYLGIEGDAIGPNDRAFETFRNNRLPDGNRLTPRDGENRIRFHDIQCSAQKSVSIMAVTAGDSRLIDAHERSCELAFAELEKFAACQANTLTERNNQVTGNLVAAKFTHTASRALDPQVHSHFVTVAGTFCAEAGGWRALNEAEMYSAIRYAGKVYQNAMAAECLRLGYDIRYVRNERQRITGFELEGVSDEMMARFSKRREEIERGIAHFVAKRGRQPTSTEIHAITTLTRDPKLKEVTTPEVIRAQRDQLTEAERTWLETLKREAMNRAAAREGTLVPELERECLRYAMAHLYERECVARGHELLAEALNQKLGHVDLAKLQTTLNGPELVRVPMDDSCALKDVFVTPAGIRREQWIVAVAAEDKGRMTPLAEPAALAEHLSTEQAEAVRELLSCRDRMAALRGVAGVGKTTVLREVDKVLREAGRSVAHCAPTASAADTLNKDGLAGAVTLAAFLERAESNPMPPGSVMVVDESGLASHRDGAAVLRLAMRRDWRVIFTGDTRQHASVDAGDFLRLLETKAGIHHVELTEIRRQTDLDYRRAIRLMAEGEAKAGLVRLDELGWVKEGNAEYLENAATEYADALIQAEDKSAVLCVAPTWAENHALTGAIRDKLKVAKVLGDGRHVTVYDPLSWTTAEKQDAARFRPGLVVVFERDSGRFRKGNAVSVVSVDGVRVLVDAGRGRPWALPLTRGGFEVCAPREIEVSEGDRLLLRANDPKMGLVNGKVVEVESFDGEVIVTREGSRIPVRDYARFTHGYVATSHKSQGMTADRVVVAADRLDAKAAYVACSRGRTRCSVHTPDRARLLGSLPPGDRPLVAEFMSLGELVKANGAAASPEPTIPVAAAAMPGPWARALDTLRRVLAAQELGSAQKEAIRHE